MEVNILKSTKSIFPGSKQMIHIPDFFKFSTHRIKSPLAANFVLCDSPIQEIFP